MRTRFPWYLFNWWLFQMGTSISLLFLDPESWVILFSSYMAGVIFTALVIDLFKWQKDRPYVEKFEMKKKEWASQYHLKTKHYNGKPHLGPSFQGFFPPAQSQQAAYSQLAQQLFPPNLAQINTVLRYPYPKAKNVLSPPKFSDEIKKDKFIKEFEKFQKELEEEMEKLLLNPKSYLRDIDDDEDDA